MPRSALAKVKDDYCCTLDEMAKTMTELAKDDPPATAEKAAEETSGDGLMAIECRVAADGFCAVDWCAFERHCHPTNFNCPHCRCPLFEIRDSRMLRFRCRAGHAFSADCLLVAMVDARENQLASLAGSFVEEGTLARRMLSLSPAINAQASWLRASMERLESADERLVQLQQSLHAAPASRTIGDTP